MDEETEKLIARANAAIVETARLIQTNLAWQAKTHAQLKRMKLRACFQPKSYRFYSPINLPDHPYRPQDEHPRSAPPANTNRQTARQRSARAEAANPWVSSVAKTGGCPEAGMRRAEVPLVPRITLRDTCP